VACLIALGDLGTAERELGKGHALAVRLRQPFALHFVDQYASTLALCFGRLAEAEAAARRSHQWSRLLTARPASGTYGIQMFGIRREQGALPSSAKPSSPARVRAARGARVWRRRWPSSGCRKTSDAS
jgi:hypothetical protein